MKPFDIKMAVKLTELATKGKRTSPETVADVFNTMCNVISAVEGLTIQGDMLDKIKGIENVPGCILTVDSTKVYLVISDVDGGDFKDRIRFTTNEMKDAAEFKFDNDQYNEWNIEEFDFITRRFRRVQNYEWSRHIVPLIDVKNGDTLIYTTMSGIDVTATVTRIENASCVDIILDDGRGTLIQNAVYGFGPMTWRMCAETIQNMEE